MATASTTSCVRSLPHDAGDQRRTERAELVALARRPWTLRVEHQPFLVRPSSARDIAAVAQMHARCSARALLDRYRCGGRAPAVAALDWALRNPLSFVAVGSDGRVIASAIVKSDAAHDPHCAEVGLLVENEWGHRGVGGELMTHLAGTAQAAGFTELIAYPATAVASTQRLMIDVGRTRMVPDGNAHLHTYLPESATLGLGSVRQRLAG